MAFDQPISLGIGFEVVGRFDKTDVGLGCQVGCHPGSKFGMRVDSAADRGAAGRQLEHGLQCPLGTTDRQGQLPGQSADFLSQS